MILRTVSPMPMGRKPGHLSRAMSLQATNADSPLGSTKHVQNRLATDVRVSHNSVEADLNEVRSRFHAAASRPEGPAAPSILRAVLRINFTINLFKDDGMRLYNWGVSVNRCSFLERLVCPPPPPPPGPSASCEALRANVRPAA